MTAVAEQVGNWLAEFTAQPGAEPWVQQLREAAFHRFSELGLPTTHNEEWRFTNVAPIARVQWANAPSGYSIPENARDHMGQYAPRDNAFVALNTAFLGNVQFVRVPAGAVLE